MIDFSAIASGLALLFSEPSVWLVIFPGLLIGLVAGAIPGISGSMAMVILLPMTLYMDFLTAVMLLTSVFTGAGFGCAIPAILMRIPGTPAAVATTFDGFPMTEKGQHNEALGMGLSASAIGCALSYLMLMLLIVPLAVVVLALGPLELFLIAVWGLTLIAALSGGNMVKGLMAGLIGVLLGTVGMSDAGYLRGTMGFPELLDGIPAIPALLGLFIAGQLFNSVDTDYIVADAANRTISFRRILAGMRMAVGHPLTLARGSLIGVVIGIVPGIGSSVSNLVAYSEARRTDPDPDSFGKGNPKGVIASESGNSSSEGGSLTTLLALGIPGSGATAILFSAFAMHNVVGGPRLITQQTDLVYAIIFGNLLQCLALLVVGIFVVYAASRIVSVPMRVLIPSVLAVSVFGAYSLTGNMAGPVTFLLFAVFGWLLSRFDYPVTATVIGLMLGNMVESELLRSYQISRGHLGFLFERPIALGLALIIVLTLAWPSLKRRLATRQRRRAADRTVEAPLAN